MDLKKVKPKPTIRSYVAERVAAGLCLIGPKVSKKARDQCKRCAEKRGTCTMHYQQFRAEYLEAEDRIEFEAKQIREGRILNSGQGSPSDHVNVYAEA